MNEFRRMMQKLLKSKWQENWMLGCFTGLFIGLMLSRAMVSFAAALLVVPYFFSFQTVTINKKIITGILLILLPVLVSGFWSSNTSVWWNSVLVKIPLLTLFLGLSAFPFDTVLWKRISLIFILIISIGCAWSMAQYFRNPAEIQAAYLKAKVLPTPADHDYVRFSWMVVIAIVLGIKIVVTENKKITRNILIATLVFLTLYLHVLATKTGLLCLYTSAGSYLFHLVFVQKKWKAGLMFLLLLFGILIIAYLSLTTLRNRVQYVLYDFSLYSKGNTIPGYNDAARLQSLKAGWEITNENPLTGVGFGNIPEAINNWHEKNHPQSLPYERFRPANEWLVYGTGSGWPGMISFSMGIFILLFAVATKNPLSQILGIISLIPLITDDTLEGQYGVVLLAFIAFFGQKKFPA